MIATKNQELLLANEAGDWTPQDNVASNEPGVIYAANETRFTQAHFSEPLTTYSVGWRDQEGLQELLDFVAPPVEVPRRFEYVEWSNMESFQVDTDDIRAIGSDFKRVEITSIKSTAKVPNKGLTYRVDLDNVDQSTNWREKIVSHLQTRMLRSEVKRSIALLVAAATNSSKTWDTTSGKDPDQDMLTEVITSTGIIGIPPTNLLIDLTAWALRAKAHRAQNSAGGFSSAGLSVQQVAEQIGCTRGMIARHKYTATKPTSKTSAKTSIAGGNYALIYLANPGQSVDDPSCIKRFVSMTMGGTKTRVYEQQTSMKMIDISVEMYSLPLITADLGIRSLTIS